MHSVLDINLYLPKCLKSYINNENKLEDSSTESKYDDELLRSYRCFEGG
jgi:hypothetical protein